VERPSTGVIVAGFVAVAIGLVGCAAHPSEDRAAATDTSTLVAAGIARIQWNANQDADLNIRQMSGLDAVDASQTSCAKGLIGGRALYFDLNWRGVVNRKRVAGVTLTMLGPNGDALTVAEPDGRCVPLRDYRIDPLPPLDGEQLVLQLLGANVPTRRGPIRLTVLFNGHRESLRLAPACAPDGGQDAARTCAIDPVSFDEGSGYSVRWSL
jgi:hypothetical protein